MVGLLQASSSVPSASLNLLVKLAAAMLKVSWIRASAESIRRQASPAAAGHWSITICPIDNVGQGPPVQIGAQIVAEEVDPPMPTHVITAARDMRGDGDALIVPEAMIGFMFKLTDIDV